MSFVLRREAKLAPQNPPDSPKLWKPGMASSGPDPVSSHKPEPARPSADDLYRFYEDMPSTANPDLSLKDIVERMKKPIPNGPLKVLREREALKGGRGNQQQQQQRGRHELLQGKSKVMVPPKANGEQQIHGHRKARSSGKSFADVFDNRVDEHRKSDVSDSFLKATSRTPEFSPGRKSFSSAKMPPGSPMRSDVFQPSPSNEAGLYQISPRSPMRSPMASPHRRISPFASASFPAGRDGLEDADRATGRRLRETSNNSEAHATWAPRTHSAADSGGVLNSGSRASPLSSDPRSSTDGSNKFMLGDAMKTTSSAAAPPLQKVPFSMHCSTCSSYTLFKTRCLVCGNIYCRNCVKDAMGQMPEGRKCSKTCLGRPIDRKYRREAGTGCFCLIPQTVKPVEARSARRHSPSNSARSSTPRSSNYSMPRTNLLNMPSRSSQSHYITPPRISVS